MTARRRNLVDVPPPAPIAPPPVDTDARPNANNRVAGDDHSAGRDEAAASRPAPDTPPHDSDEDPPPRPDDSLSAGTVLLQAPYKPPTVVEDEAKIQAKMRFLRIDREAKRRVDAEERPPLTLPPVITLRDRLALPQAAARWRIDGWLPVNARVMLTAQYKGGKTTLITNLIRSLVDGDPWLGSAAVTPIEGAVVLVDAEMAAAQLDDWYRDQGIRNDHRVVPLALRGAVTGFNVLDRTVRSQWAAYFRTIGAQYLILDCLRPFLDALGLDEQHDAGRFLVAFDALLAEAGIPEATVVHHMGHAGERARGDSRLRDWPDVEWRLVRQSDDTASARYLAAFGRDVDVPESELRFDLWRHITLTGAGSRQEATLRRALETVRAALANAAGPLSVRGLQQALEYSDYSRGSIRAAIKHGVRTHSIIAEKGPKNALLHRLAPADTAASRPAVGERASVPERAMPPRPLPVSECASASIEARTLTHTREEEIPDPPQHTRPSRPAGSRRPRRTDRA